MKADGKLILFDKSPGTPLVFKAHEGDVKHTVVIAPSGRHLSAEDFEALRLKDEEVSRIALKQG